MKRLCTVLLVLAVAISGIAQTDMSENIAMIKKNLTESKEKIKNYEWIETMTTSLKGEDKSVKQNQCYYSVDGKLTKVPTGATTAPAKTPGGIRGKAVANKKEEMADYIKACVAQVHTYLPPDAAKLQQIYAAGKATIQVLEPGKKFKLNFPDYNVKGDMLSISVDKVNQKIMALDVNTYVDDPAKKVVFNVTYSNLPDGTQYENTTTLDAQGKDLKIVIANSGYKKAAGK